MLNLNFNNKYVGSQFPQNNNISNRTSEESCIILKADLQEHSMDESATFVPELTCLSEISLEMQTTIGSFLQYKDLQRLGQTCKNLDEAREMVLTDNCNIIKIEAPETLSQEIIEQLKKVKHLHLCVNNASDENMHFIGQLTNLHSLDLGSTSDTHLSDNGVSHLRNLSNLHSLNLYNTDITDNALPYLNGLTNLHSLNLCKTKITDKGLPHLRSLTNLHLLDLRKTNITDIGLSYLTDLTNLHLLYLHTTNITDIGLTHLRSLINLHLLYLRNTNITDNGLTHIGCLINLHSLYLLDENITEKGLPNLRSLTNLHSLYLYESTNFTNNGLQSFKIILPQANVIMM